ncbi:MAG: tetratricopeptide repeat protein, partial [Myxococcota bacterium]|nr:tetratricopeptide repeat protein [Myxococcota bacterium]
EPENSTAYRNLSRIYFAQGEYALSQLTAEKARSLANSDDPGIYNNMGVTYLEMGDEPAAIKEFQTAIKLDADHVQANMNLGYVSLNSGDYALAFNCFDTVLGTEPGNIDAKLGMAVALRGGKEYEKASKLYEQIIAADPDNDLAFFNASTLHERYMKDFKQALKYLDSYKAVLQDRGELTLDHQVFARVQRIEDSKAAEEAAKAKEEERKRQEEERKQREKERFEVLKTEVAKLDALMKKYSTCGAMVDSGGLDMGMMILEQAQMVVEAEAHDMAGDMMMFFDDLNPQLEPIIPLCDEEMTMAPQNEEAPAGEAPAGEAPAEEAPAGEAPAEEAPAEEPGEPAQGGWTGEKGGE